MMILNQNLYVKSFLMTYTGPLEKQMLYDPKQTGDIYKYYDQPKNDFG